MKSLFRVRYKSGLMSESVVTALDADEAMREAISLCRFNTTCVPDWYGPDDIVESITPAGDKTSGKWGVGFRPVSEFESREDFAKIIGPGETSETGSVPVSGEGEEPPAAEDYGFSEV